MDHPKTAAAAPVRRTEKVRDSRLWMLLRAIRVHQWVKNGLVLVPLVTSHRIGDVPTLAAGVLAFLSFSSCASGVYLINDLLDLEADRRHPTKRYRPLAAGDLSVGAAAALVPVLLAASLTLALLLPMSFVVVLVAYAIMTTVYSLLLKHVALADVIALAVLYTVRIVAGFAATGIEFSAWLLAFSLFFFLNLAFVKRYAELYALLEREEPAGKTRDYYADDLQLIEILGAGSGYISVLVFALYTNSERVAPLYASPILLWLICPLQLYWIGRVWLLAHRGQMHDDPVVFAITDRVSYFIGIAVAIILMLATTIGRR